MAFLVVREPFPVRHHVGAGHAREIAVVVGAQRARGRDVALELRLALAAGGRGAQQRHVGAMLVHAVEVGARALVDLDLGPAEKIGERLQAVLHGPVDLGVRVVEHQRDLELAQILLLRRR
jgi:hypothetical protein